MVRHSSRNVGTEERRSRAVVEVTSDPGMEEDETLMGRFRRTLKPFRSEIVSVLIRRGGVVLGLSDWSQVVSSCRIWMAIERSLSLGRIDSLGAIISSGIFNLSGGAIGIPTLLVCAFCGVSWFL